MRNKKDSEAPKDDEGRELHLRLKKGDLNKNLLMPGDPKRSEIIAGFWDEKLEVGRHRQYVAFSGKYKSAPISVVSSGIGPSATEIALIEAKNLGVENVIRVGSCGALSADISVGSLVISEGAVRLENTSDNYVIKGYPAVSSFKITQALIRACEENNADYHIGITATASSFYVGQGRKLLYKNYLPSHRKDLVEDLQKAGVKNFEMETSLLLVLGRILNLQAGAICAVYANRATKDFEEIGMDDAIKISCEAIRIIHES